MVKLLSVKPLKDMYYYINDQFTPETSLSHIFSNRCGESREQFACGWYVFSPQFHMALI